MGSTILQIAQYAAERGVLGIRTPTSLIGNSDKTVIKLKHFIYKAVDNLIARNAGWSSLIRTQSLLGSQATVPLTTTANSSTITTTSTAAMAVGDELSGENVANPTFIETIVDSTTVTVSRPATTTGTAVDHTWRQLVWTLPADFKTLMQPPCSLEHRSWSFSQMEMSDLYRYAHDNFVQTNFKVFALNDGRIQIYPALSTSESVLLSYRSNYYYKNSAGTRLALPTADTDTIIQFSDSLVLAAIEYLWLMEIGASTADAMSRTIARLLEQAAQADRAHVSEIRPNVKRNPIYWASNLPGRFTP